ncbi:uncharacterized protein LACBIDRAFT_326095 [Laccaria bicolor S238N-H82]|uniref:Predicted protein n=1 Tax=Laccaria bicolor (strain S238N-H82 / ATCC MYA-4686) TaxID=486041 RepID=B0D7A1_LACBS|nr:uncharacterized protein LACBIDRAFT_326095 [Laccaria bicolor S238N-H82]EDR09618.1 predicted protein [Laccaria bicolor S238N-H82]|eukprot:XP_001879967.1 predicted protein [Laccaria bicolor S238N-H82]
MFATGNGIDEVVTTAAEVPSTFDAQFWDVIAVEGKENVYTIVQRTYRSAPGGSWSLQENSAVYPVPVITSQGSAEWRIFPSEENSDAFTSLRFLSIQLVTTALGVDRYVGTNDANQVVVISIPVVAHPEQDIPQWKFLGGQIR